jgi:hypothetical protein
VSFQVATNQGINIVCCRLGGGAGFEPGPAALQPGAHCSVCYTTFIVRYNGKPHHGRHAYSGISVAKKLVKANSGP